MNMPYKSLEFLRVCLAEAGWNKEGNTVEKFKRFYLAGKILAEVLPELPEAPIPPTTKAMQEDPTLSRAFLKSMEIYNGTLSPDFTLDDKMLSCCQVCIRFFIDESRLPTGKYSNILFDTLQLT